MKYLLLLLFTVQLSFASEAEDIVKKVQDEISKVKSFESNISVKLDISYVNIPVKEGKMKYNYPDKTEIDIDGFSFLPKQGIGNFVGEILKEENINLLVSGAEQVDGINTKILTVIPIDQPNGLVLVRFWVDTANNVVLKAELTTKDQGTFAIRLFQKKIEDKYWLPEKTQIKFKVGNFSIPTAFVSAQDKQKVKKQKGDTEGEVTITFSNYKVN